MKALRLARAFGAGFALVMLGIVAHAVVSPMWGGNGPGSTYGQPPGMTGPWLGDFNFNIYSLWRNYTYESGYSYVSGISADQTSGQANCTQLSGDAFQQVSTSASTGYVCLPTAISGKRVTIVMVPAQTLDIYSSATSFTSGTADTINGTAGTSAYTTNTGSNKTTICNAVNNGAWNCLTGS